MDKAFVANNSVYTDQNYDNVESAYANGRIYFDLRYNLTWSSDGSNILEWKPDREYVLMASNMDLSNPEIRSSAYFKTDKTALFKVFSNAKGMVSLTSTFDSENHREQFKNLIIPQIGLLAEDYTKPNVNFWYTNPSCGPRSMNKAIEVPIADKIMFNYSSSIRPNLMNLINLPPEKAIGGKLILFHGIPGTGKTYFIRHLMYHWRSWCNFQYISDPENFFQNPAYLFEVTKFFDQDANIGLLNKPIDFVSSTNKSTLVILEDAGEFIEAESNTAFITKSLNKLLNITDGLLGQGLKLLILITTNKEARALDPAILRSGRCLSNIEFSELSELDVLEWCEKNNSTQPLILEPKLLSDLYNPRDNLIKKKIGF